MAVLLNSKTRRKLLTYSFAHADENYYVRELSSLIDEDPGNLSRELKKMKDEGLYTSVTRGRAKYYSLNKKYPLFKELKTIIFKTEGVEGSLRQIVGKYKGISFASIYGSYAKNKEKKTSDIDLLVVGEFANANFNREIRDLETKINREINYTSYSWKEFEKERKKEGGFLYLVLNNKIIVLKGALDAR